MILPNLGLGTVHRIVRYRRVRLRTADTQASSPVVWGRDPVSERTKHVCLVILAQAGCLGVGLWMQHHFVVSSTRTEAVEQTWVELDESAQRVLSYLSDTPLSFSEGETLDVVRLRRLAASAVSQATGVCIVDASWTVLFNEPAAAPLGGPELTVGAHMPWTAESGPVVDGAPHSRGALEGPT